MKKIIILYCILLMTYFIGSYRGYVAVWQDDHPQPMTVFPYCTRFFPDEDRKLLDSRIAVESKEELTARMEDLMS